MKRVALALLCILALPAGGQSLKDGVVAADQTEAIVTVVSVNVQKRSVIVRNPKGGSAVLAVPPEAQNLDRVKPGDRFRMKYIEAVAVGISKSGEPVSDSKREVKVAPRGGTPGGMVVTTQTRAVVIDAIDYTNRYIAARVADGQTIALKVADEIPLQQLSPGDRITVVHTQALAVTLEAEPAKPGAKKTSAQKM